MAEGLALDQITKDYGALRALHGLSFTVGPGELFGFVGSNGAGKTTAMRIILGVLASDAGSVLLDGCTVDAAIRRQIGYMPAERGLYPRMKVGEQLSYFARLHGLSASRAAESVQRWTERLEISARIDDTVDTLSTGNQQRVQLAAALVHDPRVLVLDEPFSGLDPVAVDVMTAVLTEKSRAGVPVLFSSHQLELVEQICDRVGILAEGRLVALGTVDELRAHQPLRLEVTSDAVPVDWAAELSGVRVVAAEGGRYVFELDEGADDQEVLNAALGHGPMRGFTRTRSQLSEIYREVVSA